MDNPTYQPGDVANGHILAQDGTWQLVGATVEPVREPKNGFGIAALILGIMGAVSGLIPLFFWFALAMGVTALVLGLVGLARVKRGAATNRKTTLWGTITGGLAVVLGIVGLVIVINAANELSNDLDDLGDDPAVSAPAEPAPAAPAEPAPAPEAPPAEQITLAEFNSLTTGMTYEQAVATIGGPGTVMSETDVVGVHTVLYTWEGVGGFGANANAMFQDNGLINKSQFGLE